MKRPRKNKLVIAVTGSFGTGKSTVAAFFESRGGYVIDADKLARECLRKGSSCYRKALGVFGRGILDRGGFIERRKLGGLVFKNKNLLARLEAIIHPEVIRRIKKKVNGLNKRLVIIDAPLIIEAGQRMIAHKLVVVACSRQKQIARLKKKGISSDTAKEVINSQLPLRLKMQSADFIIDNNGTLEGTRKQVGDILSLLRRQASH